MLHRAVKAAVDKMDAEKSTSAANQLVTSILGDLIESKQVFVGMGTDNARYTYPHTHCITDLSTEPQLAKSLTPQCLCISI